MREIVDGLPGSLGAVIMGLDGIAVESYVKSDDETNYVSDVNTAGMEFSYVMGQVRKASAALSWGAAVELLISSEKAILLFRMISEEYFLAVVLNTEANIGKCRYMLRVSGPLVAEEL